MRITILQLLALFGTLHIADPALANVFGDDNRRQTSADENPLYRRVGIVTKVDQNIDNGHGTAWLSGECLIVTHYYAAFFKSRREDGEVITTRAKRGVALDFHVDLQPGRTKSFAKKVRAEVIDFGNSTPGYTTGPFVNFALLMLDQCIGRDLGFLEVKPFSIQYWKAAGELTVIGYPQDRWTDSGVTVESGCKQDKSARVAGATLDCAFAPGSSGSPVLETQENGAYLVTGMVTGGSSKNQAEKYDVRSGSVSWTVLSDVFAESILEARYDIEPHTLSDEVRKRIATRRSNEAYGAAFGAMPSASKGMKTSASGWRAAKLSPDGRDAYIYYLQRPDVCTPRGCMTVVLSRPYVGRYSDTKIVGKFTGLPLPEFSGPARTGQWRTLYVADENPRLYREITFEDGEYRLSSRPPVSEAEIREQGGEATGLKAQQ